MKFQEFQSENPENEWDNHLSKFRDHNISQSYGFGEYSKSRNQGSNAKRYVLLDGNRPVVMAQAIHREIPAFRAVVVGIKGGPVFKTSESTTKNLSHLKKFLENFINSIKNKYKIYYLNIQYTSEGNVHEKLLLRETGWAKPVIERNTPFTFIVPMYDELEDNFKGLNSKWRNQLRRAERLDHYFESGNSDILIQRYLQIHNDMCKLKNMSNLALKEADLINRRNYLKDNLQLIIGSLDNEDVCGCVVTLFKDKGYYLYAASNENGRQNYSANAMVWYLIKRLKQMGVRELDLLGIDPYKNWGGYHFKKGVGGRSVEFLGEWEYSSSNSLKILMNVFLYYRSRFLR